MIDSIARLIKESHNILIITHQKPDGDAIGSSTALYFALKKLGKKVQLVCKDKIPPTFLFISGSDLFKKSFLMGDGQLIILLDCGDLRRTGFSDRIKKYASTKKTLINIDHHLKNDLNKIANFNLSDTNSASTSQIVYKLIKNLSIDLDKEIADSLLSGAYFDTGGFRHNNTSSEVLDFASLMMTYGASVKSMPRIDNKHQIKSLKLWGYALENISYDSLGIAKVVITKNDLEKIGASEKDILGLANVVAGIDGVKIALVLWETEDGFRGMLRTKQKNINVSHLAKYLGGGGFRCSAGFVSNSKIDFIKNQWIIKSNESIELKDKK